MSKTCDNRGWNAISNMWFNHTLAMKKLKILYVIKELKSKDQFVYYVNVLRQAESKRRNVFPLKLNFFPFQFLFLLFVLCSGKKPKRQQGLMKRPFVYRFLHTRNDRWIPSLKQFLCFWKNSNDCVCCHSQAIDLHWCCRETSTSIAGYSVKINFWWKKINVSW